MKNWILNLRIKYAFHLNIHLDIFWLGKCNYLEIHTTNRHTRRHDIKVKWLQWTETSPTLETELVGTQNLITAILHSILNFKTLPGIFLITASYYLIKWTLAAYPKCFTLLLWRMATFLEDLAQIVTFSFFSSTCVLSP